MSRRREHLYQNPTGTWHVTTEGDCEGKSTRDLGIHDGHVVDIARKLARHTMYELRFHRLPDPVRLKPEGQAEDARPEPKGVNISFDVESGTWPSDMSREDRADWLREMLGPHPDLRHVEESRYYSAIKLNFKPRPDTTEGEDP